MKLTPIIAKQHYFKPGKKNRLGLWKFLTYLGSRDGAGQWVDRGMGATREDIMRNGDERKSRQVQVRDLVISPDPHLWKHVPESSRHRVISRVTERSIEKWYRDNGWGEADYTYVPHDKEEDGSEKLHTHVILPGTIQPDPLLQERAHRVRPVHLEDLRRTASANFIAEMERELGRYVVQQILKERDAQLDRERGGLDRGKLSEVAAVVSLMKQQKRDKVSKKTAQRQAERQMRLLVKQKERARNEAAREQRQQAREVRLAERERIHQEKLAAERRAEMERNRRPTGFSREIEIDL